MIIVINVKNLWIGKIVNSKLDIKILIILQYCRSLIPPLCSCRDGYHDNDSSVINCQSNYFFY